MNTDEEIEMYGYEDIEQIIAENEAIQEAYDAAEALKPKLLFKYKSVTNCLELERLCDILANNTIYVPSAIELNDPLEGTNAKSLSNNYAGREKILAQQRILSLSSSCFLSTLWAHYAGNYSGICLGYRRRGAFANAKEVEYVKRQTIWSDAPESGVPLSLNFKSDEWKYEQEWRLIYSVKEKNENFFLRYEQKELACVLLGCKMTPFIQDIIRKYVSPGVGIYTVFPDKQKYCLYARKNADCEGLYSVNDILNDLSIDI